MASLPLQTTIRITDSSSEHVAGLDAADAAFAFGSFGAGSRSGLSCDDEQLSATLVSGNLIVPSGRWCDIIDTTIKGNLVVLGSAGVRIEDSSVAGSMLAVHNTVAADPLSSGADVDLQHDHRSRSRHSRQRQRGPVEHRAVRSRLGTRQPRVLRQSSVGEHDHGEYRLRRADVHRQRIAHRYQRRCDGILHRPVRRGTRFRSIRTPAPNTHPPRDILTTSSHRSSPLSRKRRRPPTRTRWRPTNTQPIAAVARASRTPRSPHVYS